MLSAELQKRWVFFPYKSLYLECCATMPVFADVHISSLGYLCWLQTELYSTQSCYHCKIVLSTTDVIKVHNLKLKSLKRKGLGQGNSGKRRWSALHTKTHKQRRKIQHTYVVPLLFLPISLITQVRLFHLSISGDKKVEFEKQKKRHPS